MPRKKTTTTNTNKKFQAGVNAFLQSDTKKKPTRKPSTIIEKEDLKKEITQEIISKQNAPKKIGRHKRLKNDVKYIGLGCRIKETTKDRMKVALITTVKKTYPTQDLFVDFAINFTLDYLEGKVK